MLELRGVSKRFERRGRVVAEAVKEAAFAVREREIFALVGESGSGKSTLAELIVGLQRPSKGDVVWSGSDVRDPSERCVQLVFQNPDRSLNPYWRVRDIVAEPLLLAGVPRAEARERTGRLLRLVGLPEELLARRPSECSGGQKQRVAIARALALSPKLLVADEVTSALDTRTEAAILGLLRKLRDERGMAILYITHRLETLAGFADRVAVMRDGTIVETGETDAVLHRPAHEYTRSLLAALSYARAAT